MNRRQRLILSRIFTDPVPADIRWSEIEALFLALGAEVSEGAGSRVRVALTGAVRSVREFLEATGTTPAGEQDDA